MLSWKVLRLVTFAQDDRAFWVLPSLEFIGRINKQLTGSHLQYAVVFDAIYSNGRVCIKNRRLRPRRSIVHRWMDRVSRDAINAQGRKIGQRPHAIFHGAFANPRITVRKRVRSAVGSRQVGRALRARPWFCAALRPPGARPEKSGTDSESPPYLDGRWTTFHTLSERRQSNWRA